MGLYAFRRLRERKANEAAQVIVVEQEQSLASPAPKRRYTKKTQASKNKLD